MCSVETLSDSPASFPLIRTSQIRFRSLQSCDLPLLVAWLNRDFVTRWFGDKVYSLDEVMAKYEPRICGEVPVNPYLMLYDGLPIGYIEMYCLADRPRYNYLVGAGPGTAGLDFFIGEWDYLYGGFDIAMVEAFLKRVVFRDCDTERCIAGADVRNREAIQCYEQIGFELWKLVRVPSRRHAICLMVLDHQSIS